MRVRLQAMVEVIDSEDLHLIHIEVLERDELPQECFEHFDELVLIDFEEVFD